MKELDDIKDLFNEKLGNFEAPVRPEMWSSISSQIGVTSTATSGGGLSVFAKTIIGFTVAASVAVGGYFIVKEVSSNKKEENNSEKNLDFKNQDIKTASIKESTTGNQESIQVSGKNIQMNYPLDVLDNLGQKDNVIYNAPIINQDLGQKQSVGSILEEGGTVKKENNTIKEIISDNPEVIENDNKEEKSIDSEKTDDVDVTFDEFEIGELKNIFTPNGDRINDFLSVESKGLTDFNVVVLDQNSKCVYQSNQADFVWDGTGKNGEVVPEGNYVYYITARDSKGKIITKHSMLRIEY